ncbi:MAG: hypothetical protein U1C51_05005, partial [Candidatus Izemoplasmatales bacterium]|nr:hypothetical protein [Candidatus Izemoplasmatales bacterium]
RFLTPLILFVFFFQAMSWIPLYAEVDKPTLQARYDEIQTRFANSSNYYNASSTAFVSNYQALGGNASVEALLADDLALESDVNQWIVDLTRLLSQLTLDTTYIRISASYWNAKSESLSTYTLRSITLYNSELLRIKAIIDEPTSGEQAMLEAEDELLLAKDLLVLLADKTELTAKWNELLAIYSQGSLLYTPQSFDLFTSQMDLFQTNPDVLGFSVLHVVTDSDTSIIEAQIALALLVAAQNQLVQRADKTQLMNDYQMASTMQSNPYTPNSYAQFMLLIIPVASVINNLNATFQEVQDAINTIEAAYTVLVLQSDKTQLEIMGYQVLIAYYEERHLYTANSYELFKTAVLAYGHYFRINQLLADLNASQEQVDLFTATVQGALDLLVLRADITELMTKYQQAQHINIEAYTPHSVSIYQSQLILVGQVIQSSNTDTQVVQSALFILDQATDLLVLKAQKNNLLTQINRIDSLIVSRYSKASLDTLQLYLVEAQAIYQNPNASQALVDDYVTHLQTIIQELIWKRPTLSIRANQNPIDLSEYIFLYRSSIKSIVSSDPSIIEVDELYQVQGKRFGNAILTITLSNGVQEEIQIQVKSEVQVITVVFASLIPVSTLALGATLIFFKPEYVRFLKKIAFLQKKP